MYELLLEGVYCTCNKNNFHNPYLMHSLLKINRNSIMTKAACVQERLSSYLYVHLSLHTQCVLDAGTIRNSVVLGYNNN